MVRRSTITWASPRDPHLSEYRNPKEQADYLDWCREYVSRHRRAEEGA